MYVNEGYIIDKGGSGTEDASWKHAVTAGRIRCAKDLAHGSVRERMELLPLTSIVVR